jgi:pyruvate dehydrogenase E2 component (dihydrolipoamide acetyltransferase)
LVTTVVMPKLGLTMTKGTVVKWYRAEGERVAKDEPIVKIATEKVSYDVTAPAPGLLLKIVAPTKSIIPVSQPIAFIGEPGESLPEIPVVASVSTVAPAATSQPAPLGSRLPAGSTPRAKKLAAEKGVDLALVKGTGPGGLILEEDVLKFIDETRNRTRAGLTVREIVPMSETRKVIAERMSESLHTTAQVTITTKVDMTELRSLREKLLPGVEQRSGVRLTYTDLLVKIAARALTEHPIMNSTVEDDLIKTVREINIGVAVATEAGLLVPVVKGADGKSIYEIAEVSKALVEKARKGELTIEDISGGTFTITNLGMFRVDAFTPIINPPPDRDTGCWKNRGRTRRLRG